MKLNDLKNQMMIVDEEIRLDKTFMIRGVKVHFMSITKVDGENTIWALYEKRYRSTSSDIDQYEDMDRTKRDELSNAAENNSNSSFINIKKFTLQGQDFNVSSSSSDAVFFNNLEAIMRLQHFGQAELLPSFLDDIGLSDICISSFTQAKGDACPVIDTSKEIDMTVLVGFDHKRYLLNTECKAGFDSSYAIKNTFYNPMTLKNCVYYLQPLYLYDIWEETRLMFEAEHFKNFSKEQIEQMKKSSYDGLKEICPKGKKLAMLKYETDDNISLDFYSKEFLDAKVTRSNTASASVFIFSPDEKIGPNGLKNKMCMIKAVDEEELNEIDIELFSFTVTLPEFSLSSIVK